jgi:hypothetical protein
MAPIPQPTYSAPKEATSDISTLRRWQDIDRVKLRGETRGSSLRFSNGGTIGRMNGLFVDITPSTRLQPPYHGLTRVGNRDGACAGLALRKPGTGAVQAGLLRPLRQTNQADLRRSALGYASPYGEPAFRPAWTRD